jgi:glutamate synthase (NADPH/NADH) large chain
MGPLPSPSQMARSCRRYHSTATALRPSRYYVTKDDVVIMASEVGVLDVPPENVRYTRQGWNQAGCFWLTPDEGTDYFRRRNQTHVSPLNIPIVTWLDELSDTALDRLTGSASHCLTVTSGYDLVQRQQAFGYTYQ